MNPVAGILAVTGFTLLVYALVLLLLVIVVAAHACLLWRALHTKCPAWLTFCAREGLLCRTWVRRASAGAVEAGSRLRADQPWLSVERPLLRPSHVAPSSP